MEITEKQKQIIGIGVGVSVVGVVACAGLYYYYKKNELGYDEVEQIRLPKLTGDSRWKNIDAKYEDLDNYDNRMRRRSRFTVYSRENSFKDNSSYDGKVQKRFKVLRTDESVIDRTERLRTSGERYRHTPSGYDRNNRNANFSDLIIP